MHNTRRPARHARRNQFSAETDRGMLGRQRSDDRNADGQRPLRGELAARLMAGMTAAARSSPNHVGSLQRWIRQARELHPDRSDAEAADLGQQLKRDHFAALGRRGARARRTALKAQAGLLAAASDDA